MSATYNAYRIEAEPERARFVAVLTHTERGGEFRLSVCTCARQAIASATRGGTRPLEYLGAATFRGGVWEPYELTTACDVKRSDWTWKHHGWTHAVKLPRVKVTP